MNSKVEKILMEMIDDRNKHIKRLVEAGDRMAMWVCPEYEADPANKALKLWKQAKEVKP